MTRFRPPIVPLQLCNPADRSSVRHDGATEAPWMAVPDRLTSPVQGVFNEETMRSRPDLGRTTRADPTSWNSESP